MVTSRAHDANGASAPVDSVSQLTRVTLPRLVSLAIALGIATGLAEIATLLFKKYAFDRWINASLQIVWMAPLADAMIFLVAVLLLWPLHRRWPHRLPLHGIVGVLAFLTLVSLALIFPSLHWTALLLLPAGMASVITRVARRYAAVVNRHAVRAAALGATIVLALALGVNGSLYWREQRGIRNLAAAPDGAPNVLLLILDTVRAESLSLLGYPRATTPELERIAAQGVTFERAFSTSPWTLPAHATMFTGHYPNQVSADWESPLNAERTTLAEALAQRGWVTGGFTANIAYTVRETGLHRGFHHYEDLPTTPGQLVLSSSIARLIGRNRQVRAALGYYENLNRKPADVINSSFLGWLDGQAGERPFFAFLNYCDAHEPYMPPAPYRTMFGDGSARKLDKIEFGGPFQSGVRVQKGRMTPAEVQAEIDAYDASIAFMDRQIARLLDELQRRGRLDNTLVVITADHGEHFGEHGQWEHGRTLYSQLLHVPLVFRLPQRSANGAAVAATRVTQPVSLVDLPFTILDVVGADASTVGGSSLAPFWTHEATPAPSPLLAMVSRGVRALPLVGIEALVDDSMHYIRWKNGRTELFDLNADIRNTANLAGNERFRALTQMMDVRLSQLLQDPRHQQHVRAASSPPMVER